MRVNGLHCVLDPAIAVLKSAAGNQAVGSRGMGTGDATGAWRADHRAQRFLNRLLE